MRAYTSRLGAIVAVLGLLVGCTDDPTEPNTPPETSSKQSGTPTEGVRPGEAEFFELAGRFPAFAGIFVNSEGDLVVNVTDPAAEASVRAAVAPIQARIARNRPGTARRIVSQQVDYSFSQLADWRNRLIPVISQITGFVALDLDERRNLIWLGVRPADEQAARATLAAKLPEIGVPSQAVEVSPSEAGTARAGTSLNERHRPLFGGIRIETSSSACTLGVTAAHWPGVPYQYRVGFITASHCSDRLWYPDNTQFDQHEYLTTYDNYVGTEYLDPDADSCGNIWAWYSDCRQSDANFVSTKDIAEIRLGKIAKTTERCSGNWYCTPNLASDTLQIVADAVDLYAGFTIDKMGITSGWTTGEITNTCVEHLFAGGLLQCAYYATTFIDSGDSGGPFFDYYPARGNDVYIAGFVHGWIDTSSGRKSVFSSIMGVRNELPNLYLW
jgi:hypothetical protein